MKKGFALLELLIVIGILAILATTVTLVLNPAEMLKQARDSQRLGDLRSVHAAISMYAATATSTEFASCSGCTNTGGTVSVFSGGGSCTQNSSSTVDGIGWVTPLDLRKTSGGAPLSKLPIDPSNGATYFYAFKCSTDNTWEINANLESDKYSPQEAGDGGSTSTYYEIGNDPDLDL